MATKKSKSISILDKDLTVKGTLSSRGILMIRGTVEGSLSGEQIVVSRSGVVRADTKAERMTVAGIFEGPLEISGEVVVLSTGNCSGTLVCGKLAVEAGGVLNADVRCTPENAPVSQKPEVQSGSEEDVDMEGLK